MKKRMMAIALMMMTTLGLVLQIREAWEIFRKKTEDRFRKSGKICRCR